MVYLENNKYGNLSLYKRLDSFRRWLDILINKWRAKWYDSEGEKSMRM